MPYIAKTAKSYENRNAVIVTLSGERGSKVSLAPEIFGRTPNIALMHQVVTAQLAGIRSGTQSTKTRSEVRGGGAKPYRQKGTGKARQGSTRAPHFSGGGVALGPKPRSYKQRTPKKMISQALYSALSDRAGAERIFLLSDYEIEKPSTKLAAGFFDKVGLEGPVLLVVHPEEEMLIKSFRNLPYVELAFPDHLGAYLVLVNDAVIFTSRTLPASVTSSTPSLVLSAGTVGEE